MREELVYKTQIKKTEHPRILKQKIILKQIIHITIIYLN